MTTRGYPLLFIFALAAACSPAERARTNPNDEFVVKYPPGYGDPGTVTDDVGAAAPADDPVEEEPAAVEPEVPAAPPADQPPPAEPPDDPPPDDGGDPLSPPTEEPPADDPGPDLGACADNASPDCAYKVAPDVAGCGAGMTSDAFKQRALAHVNAIRSASGLPAVAYALNHDAQVQACALLLARGESFTYNADSACFSDAADTGCKGSLAALSTYYLPFATVPFIDSPEQVVTSFLINVTAQDSLGHRRFLLDPWLGSISFGTVHNTLQLAPSIVAQASALWVGSAGPAPTASGIAYVAYPVGEYPAELFDTSYYLSFSALEDLSNKAANAQVSYDGVVVSVTGPDGPLAVTDVQAKTGSGVPNLLQWKVDGLEQATPYMVEIGGVTLPSGAIKTYGYDFRLL